MATKPNPVEQELRTFLDDVDTKLEAYGHALEEAADSARLQIHLGLLEAEQSWEARKAAVLKSLEKLKETERAVRGSVDAARVQAHLAAMDAGSLVDNTRERLNSTEQEIGRLLDGASSEARNALRGLRHAYVEMRQKMAH